MVVRPTAMPLGLMAGTNGGDTAGACRGHLLAARAASAAFMYVAYEVSGLSVPPSGLSSRGHQVRRPAGGRAGGRPACPGYPIGPNPLRPMGSKTAGSAGPSIGAAGHEPMPHPSCVLWSSRTCRFPKKLHRLALAAGDARRGFLLAGCRIS